LDEDFARPRKRQDVRVLEAEGPRFGAMDPRRENLRPPRPFPRSGVQDGLPVRSKPGRVDASATEGQLPELRTRCSRCPQSGNDACAAGCKNRDQECERRAPPSQQGSSERAQRAHRGLLQIEGEILGGLVASLGALLETATNDLIDLQRDRGGKIWRLLVQDR